MIEVRTIDLYAKENQPELFEQQVNHYLFEGYDLLVKTDTYAKLMFKVITT